MAPSLRLVRSENGHREVISLEQSFGWPSCLTQDCLQLASNAIPTRRSVVVTCQSVQDASSTICPANTLRQRESSQIYLGNLVQQLSQRRLFPEPIQTSLPAQSRSPKDQRHQSRWITCVCRVPRTSKKSKLILLRTQT